MSELNTRQRIAIVGLSLAFGLLLYRGCDGVSISAKPTEVTYVYEKDDTIIPSPVLATFNQLNRDGILATVFEQDTVDGTGETPDQYKVPLAAAKEIGLPAMVVTAGDRVLKVVKNPYTAEHVLEAVK